MATFNSIFYYNAYLNTGNRYITMILGSKYHFNLHIYCRSCNIHDLVTSIKSKLL